MFKPALTGLAILIVSQLTHAQDDYQLGPDSQRQEGVPHGKVTTRSWTSKIFEGTVRDYWVGSLNVS
jgi:hypothetical protein